MSEAQQKAPGDGQPEGWLDAIKRAGDSLLGLVQSRFELLAVELQEEKLRAVNLLVWLAVAVIVGAAGLLVGLGALALFLWELAGYLGLIGLACIALAAAAAILFTVRRALQKGPSPFSDTIAEFKKDRECWQRKN